jgi:uncharacterized paraquat-inducible protein A
MRRCSECGNKKPRAAFGSHASAVCKRCESKVKSQAQERWQKRHEEE